MCLFRAAFVVGLIIVGQQVDGLKILIYNPTVGHSHVAFLNSLADILVDGGHVVVIGKSFCNSH
jgi:hypothetical protein